MRPRTLAPDSLPVAARAALAPPDDCAVPSQAAMSHAAHTIAARRPHPCHRPGIACLGGLPSPLGRWRVERDICLLNFSMEPVEANGQT
ncbi:MAG: hypothetical protein AMXMBFR55_04970 [Gemmatimonadota bacterium]